MVFGFLARGLKWETSLGVHTSSSVQKLSRIFIIAQFVLQKGHTSTCQCPQMHKQTKKETKNRHKDNVSLVYYVKSTVLHKHFSLNFE